MQQLRKPFDLSTAFADYQVTEIIGEGGAGRVYGARNAAGEQVAIKLLTSNARDKRSRFKNEIAFLARNQHPNIVSVIDHGHAGGVDVSGPFYVMRRYGGSLRDCLAQPLVVGARLGLFFQVLDGVEAAHLMDVTHRDLKPENVLVTSNQTAAVADFGVASFSSDLLATLVETQPTQRLANFLYAAPEQRAKGSPVTLAADIYALGLMLNELFTGAVPHGTNYISIASVSPDHAYLDRIVDSMIRQNPSDRPQSIGSVKSEIDKFRSEALSHQRLSAITATVVTTADVDDPLAFEPPILVGASWGDGILTLTLDRPVSRNWISVLNNLGNYTSVLGVSPSMFRFDGRIAQVGVRDHVAQDVINHFKTWLPTATRELHQKLLSQAKMEAQRRLEELRRQRQIEETRLRVNQGLIV